MLMIFKLCKNISYIYNYNYNYNVTFTTVQL